MTQTDQSVQLLTQLNGLLDGAEIEDVLDVATPTAKELTDRSVSLVPHSGHSIGVSISHIRRSSVKQFEHC